jgi:hypothetical protein
MGVLRYPTLLTGTPGIFPNLKPMVSTDNLATLLTPGYLSSANAESATPLSNTDVIMCLYNYSTSTTIGTFGIFTPAINTATGAITLSLFSSVLTSTVTLTAAEVDAMYATPQLIVPAPGTGLALLPTACQIVTVVSTAFAGGGIAQLQWGNTAHAGGTVALDTTTPAAEITAAASQIYTQYGVATTTVTPIATANGLGLYFTNATGPFTGGTGSTVTLSVSYMVVPV